jgi:hypothetical protein
MHDLPEHVPLPIDMFGDGPSDERDTVAVICWTCATDWPCDGVDTLSWLMLTNTCQHSNCYLQRTELGGYCVRCQDCGGFLP